MTWHFKFRILLLIGNYTLLIALCIGASGEAVSDSGGLGVNGDLNLNRTEMEAFVNTKDSLSVLDLAVPQTRPFLHAYAEYLIDYLFHRPMIDSPGPPDPLNTYVRPPVMKYCQCGIASNRIHRLDDNSPQLEFPWRVFVRSMNREVERDCAGTLISMKWLLTAASCIGEDAQYIYVSGVDENTGECWHMKTYTWTLHPFYNEVTRDSDIALVKLPTALKQSQTVQPICLPWKIRYRDFSRTTVSTSVWMSKSADCMAFSGLKRLNLPFLGSHECQMVMHRLNKRHPRITNNMVCTTRELPMSCELPDYGGSLDYLDPDAKVSYMMGIPTDPEHKCNGTTPYPHFGTRVVNYLDWIFNTAKDADFCVL